MAGRTSTAEELREKAAAATNGTAMVPAGPPTLKQRLETQKNEIAAALPKGMTAEQFTRHALTTIRNNRQLAECDPLTIIGGLMQAAGLGLDIDARGLAYLVPYKGKAQFILGYRGIVALAWRSGQLKSIEARKVCENDEFSYEYGLAPQLHHVPALSNRGKAICYYGVAHFKDGGYYFVVLGMDEIEAHRRRSASANSSITPWKSDFDSMAAKTCIRVMAPFLPLSVEEARTIAGDERAVTFSVPEPHPGDVNDTADYLDVEEVTDDIADGEIVETGDPADGEPVDEEPMFPPYEAQ